MNELELNYMKYLDEEVYKLKEKQKNLIEDNRIDEGNIEKIKINIFNIFKTIFNVDKGLANKAPNEDEKYKSLCERYIKRFDTIPQNWRESLKKAKEFNDTVNVVIEETKLSTAEKIKSEFIKISNEN